VYSAEFNDTSLLLDNLQGLNISLYLTGDELRFRSPKGAVTPELMSEIKKHKSAIIKEIQSSLTNWLTRTKSATTLDALETILQEFAAGKWTLLDKRDMSNIYTPAALRLIETEQANKWQILENLASLCWRPIHPG
jgi:hypothetical protein